MALVSLAASRRRRSAPPERRFDVPKVLVHDINDDRCTGCDACVAVCPTNVLDLVDNKSRVLNFADCIQCEACMWACPTEALVMHPEGTQPPPLRMPELDAYYQTAVPGQYLIGEVAGKPLIKNAANLGRGVIEHMLATGMKPGALSRHGSFAEGSDAARVTCVDVAIVGSGPGGLSAALSCIQRGLSYVLLEKDQTIASTVAHYPKGKLVMAEPYDTVNYSLLPVFDSNKEQIMPIWREVVRQAGIAVRLGEAVEGVQRRDDGIFDVRTNVAAYRAQRVVLATGTRGKPRTLGVTGENLPKVSSLLDDPDEFRGQPVLVVGGGDSAVEAALALADAGAKVIVSYRGRAFSRAQPKNKSAIESYAAQKRIKVKFQSMIERFDETTVTLVMADGARKKYPNAAAFVLIGADPPIRWLAKLGVEFVERPHQYQLSKSDEMVRKFVADARECPADPAAAAALARGEHVSAAALAAAPPAPRAPSHLGDGLEPVSGPRKWIRSATNIFTSAHKDKAIDRPMPLSEFAKRGRRRHAGNGRRDQLPARERTRVLRMLRDEGGRLADEDSRVYAIESRSEVVIDSPAPGLAGDATDMAMTPIVEMRRQPATPKRPQGREDSSPKQAVIVGLARAMAEGPSTGRRKRRSSPPPVPAARNRRPTPTHSKPPTPPPRSKPATRPPQFLEEPTRQVDPARGLGALISQTNPGLDFGDESTRAVDLDAHGMLQQHDALEATEFLSSDVIVSEDATGAIHIETGAYGKLDDGDLFPVEQHDESTRAVNISTMAELDRVSARELSRRAALPSEPTRAVRRPASLSDVDWDLD